EDLDGIGKGITEEDAQKYGITSQFKYIMDYRAQQGFTVIQSQQLSTYVGVTGNSWMGDSKGDIFTYGVNDFILEKFKTLDRYFEYIAEKGLVHSHTQFSYPEELIEINKKKLTDEMLEKLCRYWVARYSAYPVMWATTQEGDDDYYEYNKNTPETNRWRDVFIYVQKYDPYDHPATCHQENAWHTRVNNSSFKDLDGYTFYAMQYSVGTGPDSDQNFEFLKEYYNNEGSLPVVNYEGCYDHFWIGPKGARSQGWCAYLNGVFGHGYGMQPIWEFFWAANDTNQDSRYGETYRRDQNWIEGLTSSGGFAMGYMRTFLEQYEWWNLVPCFDGNDYYTPNGTNYSVATVGNDLYVGYFYGSGIYRSIFGTFTNMKKGEYEIKWYNPQDGTYRWYDAENEEFVNEPTANVNIKDGTYLIPGKPDLEDWVVVAKFVG
ncbi:MAG: DUF4038 domain-containing protein, partial [Clostridia bacterium]|nr:DUF4038 domain-containing protein [Clostridia bacterium]